MLCVSDKLKCLHLSALFRKFPSKAWTACCPKSCTTSEEFTSKWMRDATIVNRTKLIFADIYDIVYPNQTDSKLGTSTRFFLTAMLLRKFPDEFLCGTDRMLPMNTIIRNQVELVVTHARELKHAFSIMTHPRLIHKIYLTRFLTSFEEFKELFSEWKQFDSEDMLENITANYLNIEECITYFENQLGNASEEQIRTQPQRHTDSAQWSDPMIHLFCESLESLRENQRSIVESAYKIQPSLSPTYFEECKTQTQRIKEISNRAFDDLLSQTMKNEDYSMLIACLSELQQNILLLTPKAHHENVKQVFDIDFFQQQFSHNAFTLDNFLNLIHFIHQDVCKAYQSESRDEDTDQKFQRIFVYVDDAISNQLLFGDFVPHVLRQVKFIVDDLISDMIVFDRFVLQQGSGASPFNTQE